VLAFDDASAPDAGPARLIDELVNGARWELSEAVGEMRVLRVKS
jgi:hypothetical protein